MKKLKYLLLTMLLTFISITSVNADTVLNEFQIQSFDYNYQHPIQPQWSVTMPDTKKYNMVTMNTNTTPFYHLNQFFTNNLSNYDYISFYIFNTATNYGSNNDINNEGSLINSDLIHPLVKLNDWVCATSPVGVSTSHTSWDMDSKYWVTCQVIENRPVNKLSMEWVSISMPELMVGYQTTFVGFNETDNLKEVSDKLDNLNENITSDNVNGVENSFESFEGFIAENSTITQLITMPITLYSSILNGLQTTCQPFVLGNFLGTNLTLPCINIGNYLGSSLWSMIDIIISGFAIFAISKKFIKIFNNFSSMKEGDVIND